MIDAGFEISRGLGLDPRLLDLKCARDLITYSAMSEWLRAIAHDVDPVMGSAKTGVTREYLLTRGTDVLLDLARAVLGTVPPRTRARELASWMADRMLFLGELWEPKQNIIMCSPDRHVHMWNGLSRHTGTRTPESGLVQVGLCRFRKPTEDDLMREDTRLEVLHAAEDAAGKIIPGDVDQADADFGGPVTWLRKGVVAKYGARLDRVPAEQEYFLLACGWPWASGKPLAWDDASAWLVPGAAYAE